MMISLFVLLKANFNINNIFNTTQNLRFWSFCGWRKTSDFGVFAYSTQNLRFWSFCGGRRPSKIGVTTYVLYRRNG